MFLSYLVLELTSFRRTSGKRVTLGTVGFRDISLRQRRSLSGYFLEEVLLFTARLIWFVSDLMVHFKSVPKDEE